MDRVTLKTMAKSQIKGNIGILLLIALIVALISSAINMIPAAGRIALAVVLGPWFSFNMTLIYLGLTKGQKPQIADIFKDINNFWPAFKVQLLTSVFTMLWSLLFYIPGMVKSISYSQAMYILAENPGMGAREAITKSKQMMHGHKMEFFILVLSFIGWEILGAFTFGILYIWLIPYMSATFTNFYNSIKGNNEVPEAVEETAAPEAPAQETAE